MNNTRLGDLVDPFMGESGTEFPEKEGLAASWFFLKAQTGNTHPGACLPFSLVSAGAYSGAYITGYGLNAPNSHGRARRLFDEYTATGFTHFHQSGTGSIGSYYNYFRVAPLTRPDLDFNVRHRLVDEAASPGYYATTLGDSGVRAELTVTPCGAKHRYSFPAGMKSRLIIDFANGGLILDDKRTRASAASVALTDYGFAGHVVMNGVAIYISGLIKSKTTNWRLAVGEEIMQDHVFSFDSEGEGPELFGVFWEGDDADDDLPELSLGFSLTSAEQARNNLASFQGRSFDECRHSASIAWEEHLGKIKVSGDRDESSLFYSCFYHSLIKPGQLNGESPFYNGGAPFFTDYATIWDQYKTALPLIMTLYPETSSKMVDGLLATAEYHGEFSNGILLDSDLRRFDKQARALTHHILADARIRNLPGIDWRRAMDLMLADLTKESNLDFHETGIAHPFTHTLDLAEASFCLALVAELEEDAKLRDKCWEWVDRWKNVYDSNTGILGESQYYEGGAWNYSFRLLRDMASRIALHGGDESFIRDLRGFFGFGADPVEQPVDPDDREHMEWGFSLNRFEGFNNEPDMETPYAFIYGGRHDLTCDVVREGMKHQFNAGRGGLAGNNDSGGLTSLYVWNSIGLFPVAGQSHMLIGSPTFKEIEIDLPEASFRIVAEDTSDRNRYVGTAELNGQKLNRAFLTMKEFYQGGELVLKMVDQPQGWANEQRPPSYTDISGIRALIR